MENKEEPMKPNRYYFNKYLFKCGRCRKVLDITEHDYCPQCGQRIDWSEHPIDGDAVQKGRLVEVVHCKDCKHRYDSIRCPVALIADLLKDTKVFEYKVNGNWFCADGER